jgi:hypothetical protein
MGSRKVSWSGERRKMTSAFGYEKETTGIQTRE